MNYLILVERALRGELHQVGVIIFGGGLNAGAWINEAKNRGLVVVVRDGYAEIYKP